MNKIKIDIKNYKVNCVLEKLPNLLNYLALILESNDEAFYTNFRDTLDEFLSYYTKLLEITTSKPGNSDEPNTKLQLMVENIKKFYIDIDVNKKKVSTRILHPEVSYSLTSSRFEDLDIKETGFRISYNNNSSIITTIKMDMDSLNIEQVIEKLITKPNEKLGWKNGYFKKYISSPVHDNCIFIRYEKGSITDITFYNIEINSADLFYKKWWSNMEILITIHSYYENKKKKNSD